MVKVLAESHLTFSGLLFIRTSCFRQSNSSCSSKQSQQHATDSTNFEEIAWRKETSFIQNPSLRNPTNRIIWKGVKKLEKRCTNC